MARCWQVTSSIPSNIHVLVHVLWGRLPGKGWNTTGKNHLLAPLLATLNMGDTKTSDILLIWLLCTEPCIFYPTKLSYSNRLHVLYVRLYNIISMNEALWDIIPASGIPFPAASHSGPAPVHRLTGGKAGDNVIYRPASPRPDPAAAAGRQPSYYIPTSLVEPLKQYPVRRH